VGGCSLDAFERLVAEAGVDDDALDLIESLCDKSLLVRADISNVPRYRMSNPIRQFCQEYLDSTNTGSAARLAHLQIYRELSRRAGEALNSGDRTIQLASLRADHDNLVSAILYARDSGDRATALSMALSLHTFWEETGNLAEASELIKSLIADDLADPLSFRGAGVLLAYAPMCGNMPYAQELADRLAPAFDLDLPPRIYGQLRFTLAFLYAASGQFERSQTLYEEAGRRLVGADDNFARQSLLSAATMLVWTGRLDEASALLDEADRVPPPRQTWYDDLAATKRALIEVLSGSGAVSEVVEPAQRVAEDGLQFRLLLAAVDAATAAFAANDLDEADQWWRQILAIGLDMGHVWAAIYAVEFAAWSAAERGDDDAATVLWGCVERAARELGYAYWPWMVSHGGELRVRVAARDGDAFERGLELGASRSLHDVAEELRTKAP
jgi:tetratricopeptide (TPR) repeat protein